MIARRTLSGLSVAAALGLGVLTLAACSPKSVTSGNTPKELAFSILSAENQASMGPLWQPLLDDMSAQIGIKVKPYFSSNYTSQVEAMRFKQVQVGWFSALPALDAVERSNAEVLGRVIDAGGDETYKSVVIVRKGSGITLDKILACGQKYSFGLGDPQSTSGTLAPMAYLFTPKGIEPAKCFQRLSRSASHQSNAFSVANGVLRCRHQQHGRHCLLPAGRSPISPAKVETVWTSPALPGSSIVARKDLDPAIKEKLRQFFLTYGTGTGPTARQATRDPQKGTAYGKKALSRRTTPTSTRSARCRRPRRLLRRGTQATPAGSRRLKLLSTRSTRPPPSSAPRSRTSDDARFACRDPSSAASLADAASARHPRLGRGDRAADRGVRPGGDEPPATALRQLGQHARVRQGTSCGQSSIFCRFTSPRCGSTIQIAMWGHGPRAVSESPIPFGLACARNVSPPWLRQPMRLLMNLLRSIPDLVVGTLFIVAVGLGPFAGVMALALNTGGVARQAIFRSCGIHRQRSGRRRESDRRGPVAQRSDLGRDPTRSAPCGRPMPSTALNRTPAPPRCSA